MPFTTRMEAQILFVSHFLKLGRFEGVGNEDYPVEGRAQLRFGLWARVKGQYLSGCALDLTKTLVACGCKRVIRMAQAAKDSELQH
jgi:hypothetical protein